MRRGFSDGRFETIENLRNYHSPPTQTSNLTGITNLDMKGKTKRILVVVVKLRHRANGLLSQPRSCVLYGFGYSPVTPSFF